MSITEFKEPWNANLQEGQSLQFRFSQVFLNKEHAPFCLQVVSTGPLCLMHSALSPQIPTAKWKVSVMSTQLALMTWSGGSLGGGIPEGLLNLC